MKCYFLCTGKKTPHTHRYKHLHRYILKSHFIWMHWVLLDHAQTWEIVELLKNNDGLTLWNTHIYIQMYTHTHTPTGIFLWIHYCEYLQACPFFNVSEIWALKEKAPGLWETPMYLISCNDIINIWIFAILSKD